MSSTERMRIYRAANREAYNAYMRTWKKRTYWELRPVLVEEFGGCCVSCGHDDARVLDFDHINGGGRKQRKHLNSVSILKYIQAHREEFRLLCRNCNWLAHVEKREQG